MKMSSYLTQAAIIGSLYAVITIILAPISYGPIQVRISEALTVLPFFTPAAIPGLFVGTIIANIYGTNGLIDIVFGSIATLIAALLSYKMPKKWLVPLPPVVVNGIIVGYILHYLYEMPLLLTIAYVTAGQLIACYGLGYPLIKVLEKYKEKIFYDKI